MGDKNDMPRFMYIARTIFPGEPEEVYYTAYQHIEDVDSDAELVGYYELKEQGMVRKEATFVIEKEV